MSVLFIDKKLEIDSKEFIRVNEVIQKLRTMQIYHTSKEYTDIENNNRLNFYSIT